MEIERLARGDTIDQGIIAQTFKYSDTKIVTPLRTYDPNNESDEEYFEFGLFMSRREYKTINRRMKRGVEASVKEGNYVSSKPPYGYKREHRPDGWTLVPHEEQADVVRSIYEWYTVGVLSSSGERERIGTARIAKRLTELGVPTCTGKNKEWTLSSVRDILLNPVYLGKIRWQWRPVVKSMKDGKLQKTRCRQSDYKLVDGKHQAIISEETFEMARKIMSKNPTRNVDNKSLTNPLASLIVCRKCGHKMQRKKVAENKGGYITIHCTHPGCDTVSCQLHLLEEYILCTLQEWFTTYTFEWEQQEAKAVEDTNLQYKLLENLEKQKETLQGQLEKAFIFLEQGVYDVDTFVQRRNTLQDQIDSTTQKITACREEIANKGNQTIAWKNMLPKIKNIIETYNTIESAAIKNDMLKEVIERVEYSRSGCGGRWSKVLDDFEVTIVPKLPRA